MKIKGRIYKNKNGQHFLPFSKSIISEMKIKDSTDVKIDVEKKKIIIELI